MEIKKDRISIFFYYLSIIDFGIVGSSTQIRTQPVVAEAATKAPKADTIETNTAFIILPPLLKFI